MITCCICNANVTRQYLAGFTPQFGYYCYEHHWIRQAQQVLDVLAQRTKPITTLGIARMISGEQAPGLFQDSIRNTLETLAEEGFVKRLPNATWSIV